MTRSVTLVDAGNPFIVARSRGAKSLDQAIADEVRQDAFDRPANDDKPSAFDPDQGIEGPSVEEDVIAAHDTRINIIQQKMDELRLNGASAAPLLAKLGVKLKLAMAAQHLAAAREAIGHLPANCGLGPVSDTCRASPVAVEVATVTDHRSLRHNRHLSSPAERHRDPADIVTASLRAAPDRTVSTRGPGTDARHAAKGSTTHLALRDLAQRGSANEVAGTSAHARRLLAMARRLLEDGVSHDTHPGVKLAGLMHWDGSETWSLASYPRSPA